MTGARSGWVLNSPGLVQEDLVMFRNGGWATTDFILKLLCHTCVYFSALAGL